MTTNRTVLILGARGRLGSAATVAFAEAGWRVIAQARRALDAMPAGVQQVDVDLADTESLVAAAAGASVVVYGVNPLYTRWSQELLPLAYLGMAVAERLQANFMLPGNVYNFGADMPAVLREDTPQVCATRKGRLRIELEAELVRRAQQGRLRSTVVRAGDFYGCATGTWFDQGIVKSWKAGKWIFPGPLDRAHAWAYLPDLGRAFVAAAVAQQRPDAPAFRRWHFAGHTLTGAQLLAELDECARELGRMPAQGFRRAGMPWAFIRVAAWVVPMMRELAEMAYLWERPHALDDTAWRRDLGPLPSTDVRTALRETLQRIG